MEVHEWDSTNYFNQGSDIWIDLAAQLQKIYAGQRSKAATSTFPNKFMEVGLWGIWTCIIISLFLSIFASSIGKHLHLFPE